MIKVIRPLVLCAGVVALALALPSNVQSAHGPRVRGTVEQDIPARGPEGRMAPANRPRQSTLSPAERDALLALREEEKLAHDVYMAMAELYPQQQQFRNISASELRHAAALDRLIDRYQLTSPVKDLPAGVFPTAEIQHLYEALVAEGQTDVRRALGVGVRIEQQDIQDLQAAAGTNRADLKRVYGRLEEASQNHLLAFQRAGGQGERAGQGKAHRFGRSTADAAGSTRSGPNHRGQRLSRQHGQTACHD